MWRSDKVEELIDLYKHSPILWDVKHPDYKRRSKKYDALKNISAKMNIEITEVERKLNILATQFRRMHKKIDSMKGSGMTPEEINRNVWFGYKPLMFLADRFPSKRTTTDAQEKRDLKMEVEILHEDNIIPYTELENEIDDTVEADAGQDHFQRNTFDRQAQLTERNSNRKRNHVSNQLNERFNSMKNLVNNGIPQKDEYDLYGEQIAMKLRKMNDITRAETQHKINCVLYETELKILKRKL